MSTEESLLARLKELDDGADKHFASSSLWFWKYWNERQARIDAEHKADAVLAAHAHLQNGVGLAVHLRHVEKKNQRLGWHIAAQERQIREQKVEIERLRCGRVEAKSKPWWKFWRKDR